MSIVKRSANVRGELYITGVSMIRSREHWNESVVFRWYVGEEDPCENPLEMISWRSMETTSEFFDSWVYLGREKREATTRA